MGIQPLRFSACPQRRMPVAAVSFRAGVDEGLQRRGCISPCPRSPPPGLRLDCICHIGSPNAGDRPPALGLPHSNHGSPAPTVRLDYNALKKSYVIFICLFDPFRRNRKTYFFENLCRDEPDLPLGDGRYTIFVNTKGSVGDSSRAMDAFFRYLNGGVSSIGTGEDSDDEFVRKLDRYVLDINGDEEWRQGYMKYELNLIESYKDGRAEGISIGEAKGEANATNRMAKSLKEQGFPIEAIAKAANLSVEEVNNIK